MRRRRSILTHAWWRKESSRPALRNAFLERVFLALAEQDGVMPAVNNSAQRKFPAHARHLRGSLGGQSDRVRCAKGE
jgi:hypothetical protein